MNKTVKRLIKIGVVVGAIAGTMYVINKYIEKATNLLDKLKEKQNSFYKWKLGDVYYEKFGEGSPVLLIHDFTPYASSYEWNQMINSLAQDHTVYVMDLLGCGRSDRPSITYTNFIYVQLITDFINDIIGEKTDIITSGYSSSFAIMSTNYTSEYINKLVLINPADLEVACKEPTIFSKAYKKVLELPILGTFLYNMFTLRSNVDLILTEHYFYNPFHVNDELVDTYFESAHKKHGKGKYILASIVGNYMEAMIPHALKSCENDILIIGGKHQDKIEDIVEDYRVCKDNIESVIISKTKKLPHYEEAEITLNEIKSFIS